jgi:multiple sugar transport system permease protein
VSTAFPNGRGAAGRPDGREAGRRPRSRSRNRPERTEAIWFYVLISPWLVGFFVFAFGPILSSLYLSFTRYDMANPAQWIGLDNYKQLAADPLIWQSLKVTGLWVLGGLPLRLVVAFFFAVLMNQRLPAMGFFRTVYYLPSVVSGVAVAIVWMWLLQPQFGIVNYFLRMVGLEGPRWLSSPVWALPGFILMSLWNTGATMVIFLAGLQGIPGDYYEAAEIDGAGRPRQFLAITIPLMTPVILFNLVMGIINAFQVFTQAYVMTNGGPANSTLFYMLYLYRVAFQYSQMGYGSAMAWVLFLIVLVLTLLVFRSSGRWVYYEGGVRGR